MDNPRMRIAVARVDADITGLTTSSTDDNEPSIQRLGRSWTQLVSELALPPEPTRPCPKCSRLGMPKATVCGYCWTELQPLWDGQ